MFIESECVFLGELFFSLSHFFAHIFCSWLRRQSKVGINYVTEHMVMKIKKSLSLMRLRIIKQLLRNRTANRKDCRVDRGAEKCLHETALNFLLSWKCIKREIDVCLTLVQCCWIINKLEKLRRKKNEQDATEPSIDLIAMRGKREGKEKYKKKKICCWKLGHNNCKRNFNESEMKRKKRKKKKKIISK